MTQRWYNVFSFGVGVLLLAVVIGLFITQQTGRAAQDICRATLIIDRSGSVGPDDLTNLARHTEDLFAFGDEYELAFWTFASAEGPKVNGNYNAPFHRSDEPFFVPAVSGSMDPFMQHMTTIAPDEGTNYEQGLGYHNGIQNPNPTIRAIADQTDVFLFLTDGVPNMPGESDNNQLAKEAAWNAASRYLSEGKTIVAALIGPGLSRESLAYMLTGQNMTDAQVDSNPTLREDIIRIANYNDGSQFRAAMEKVREKCDVHNPPQPGATYNLIPAVTSNTSAVAPGSTVIFDYNVDNLSTEFTSRPTDWSVKQVVVEPGQSIEPITRLFTTTDGDGNKRNYKDGYSCSTIEDNLGDNAECNDVVNGRRQFTINDNDMAIEVGDKRVVTIDESWEIGKKLCFILTLTQPTHQSSPTQRYSRAACVTVGKAPSVQVHGGDIRVGRQFFGDPNAPIEEGEEAKILTNTLTKSDGQSFGSWAEYGAFAPNLISRDFSTGSGLADSLLTRNDWHKLTFANTGEDMGFYTGVNSQNAIPNAAGALLASRDVYRSLVADNEIAFDGDDVVSGLYQKDAGNIILKEGTLPAGKTVILNVPNGAVTIAGDLGYADGPYSSINQIPQLVIIAKSITIQADVRTVNAMLIANTQGDGRIRTCDTPGPLTDSICDKQLRINGAIMARTLELRRTAGAERGSEGEPAEVVNLRADTYLWSQNEGRNGVRARTTHNVEVPPYF